MLNPEMPPLPIRLYNRLYQSLGIKEKLDFDALIHKARRNTGLQELGEEFNDDALRVLIRSINDEAQLHPFGRLMIREKLIGQLENRLWAEYWFSQYPEILEQEVLPIVMITGLQRTGTTRIQRLFSSQKKARGLMSWEALYPAPIGSISETSLRMKRTKRNEKAVKFISPSFHAIHPIHTEQPEEDVLLLDVHFMSSSSEAILHVPGYASWLEKQDHTQVYNYEKKLLKLLQWQRSGEFWVLKSPHHLQYLDKFSKIFPESRIIWMHRNICDCIPSFLSMLYYSRNMFVHEVDKGVLKSHWLNKLALMLEGGLKYRNASPGKIMDVLYDEFIRDEQQVIFQILKSFAYSEPSSIKSEKDKLQYSSNHQYKLEDWDLDAEYLEGLFPDYLKLLNSIDSRTSEYEPSRKI